MKAEHFYRPQTKFGARYAFTPVCQSVHGVRWGLHPGGSASGELGRPPTSDNTRYDQRAGSTHPTGMHSCYSMYSKRSYLLCNFVTCAR